MNYPNFFDATLLEKRKKLISQGYEPYPYLYNYSHTIQALIDDAKDLINTKKIISTVGRISSIRKAGRALFIDLKKDNNHIQFYARYKSFEEREWLLLSKYLDIGDIVKIEGFLFHTKMGELTIHLQQVQLLCKTVVRLPLGKETEEKSYYKANSLEIKYRERYTYWTISPEAKSLIEKRFKIIQLIRNWMEKEGFLEVQTPTIEMIYGGAEARPFETNIWALDKQKAYLRISPELYLKRYIVGGFDKIFTICQNFRNEGIDKSHNPEFSMMEWYETGTDYNKQMERFEQLTEFLVLNLYGTTKIEYQGRMIDFKVPWTKLSVVDALKVYANFDVLRMTLNQLREECDKHEILYSNDAPKGILITILFENLCENHLIQPTFIIDHPYEISPLTKEKRGMPGFVERFEPFVNGMEIGNAYSEMTDPVIQFERFMEQRNQPNVNTDTDYKNHPIDLDFVKAVGIGMPPVGGVGFGVDRIIMLLTNSKSIRDILPFPLMKPI